jgi:hypothetical protein
MSDCAVSFVGHLLFEDCALDVFPFPRLDLQAAPLPVLALVPSPSLFLSLSAVIFVQF